ncbi:MAG: hypothetical protein ABW321_33690 [Polyangiales bacterium]
MSVLHRLSKMSWVWSAGVWLVVAPLHAQSTAAPSDKTKPAAKSTPSAAAQPAAAAPARAAGSVGKQAAAEKPGATAPQAQAAKPAARTETSTSPATSAPPVKAIHLPGQPQQPSAAAAVNVPCSLAEAEQPRGGRLEIVGQGFGTSPVVRIAGKPVRMIERRAERISIQIPTDSDGGAITLLNDGRASHCGELVIIGKNR